MCIITFIIGSAEESSRPQNMICIVSHRECYVSGDYQARLLSVVEIVLRTVCFSTNILRSRAVSLFSWAEDPLRDRSFVLFFLLLRLEVSPVFLLLRRSPAASNFLFPFRQQQQHKFRKRSLKVGGGSCPLWDNIYSSIYFRRLMFTATSTQNCWPLHNSCHLSWIRNAG